MSRLLAAICLALAGITGIGLSALPAQASSGSPPARVTSAGIHPFTTTRALTVQPQVTGTTLYSQYVDSGPDGYGAYSSSAGPNDYQVADDFLVPAGKSWSIGTVQVRGCTFGSQPVFFTVSFYADASGQPAATPISSQTITSYTTTVVNSNLCGLRDYTLPLPTSVSLSTGHYWLSVVGSLCSTPCGEWSWETEATVHNDAAVRDYAGGGWSATPIDVMFALYSAPGTLTITPTPSTRSCTAGSICGESIATITDTDSDPCTNYTASITWGHSTVAVGAVSGTDASSGCTITATHSYLFPGTYTVTVNVVDSDGTNASTTYTVIVGQASAAGQCWSVTGAATTSGVSFKDKAQDVRTTGGAAGGIYWQDTRTSVTVTMTSVYAVTRSGSVTTIYGTGTLTKTGSGSESGVQIREDLYGSGTYPTSVQLRVNGPIPYDSGVLPVTAHTVGVIASC